LKKLHESIELLFSNNDFKPVLRICRPFIRKRPELLHQAISNNYSDLISNFVSVAGTDLLQQKNQFGETVLLHATRLHRIDIIKAVLDRENSNILLEDINNKEQNIFHILALHANSDEIFDLFIDYLLKKSINIQEAFDHVDEDHHTPLQLTILNNNLPATRHLLKYFNKNVCETTNHIGENLIHLAVRFGDVTMLKYLLGDEQFIEQGHQTSLTMTPIELARSLKRQDMVEYLKEIYPQPEIDEDENSNSD
jgi:ankyrin repeat protein